MHTDDALHIRLPHIGEGYIIPLQKGEALIVVLKIYGLSHPFGILIDEAEDTVVGTALLFVHEVGGKLHPQIGVFSVAKLERHLFPAPGQRDLRVGIRSVETVIQHVANPLAAHGQ